MLDTLIRWYMAVFFILFGTWMVWKRGCFALTAPLLRAPRGDGAVTDRFREAVRRRTALESIPSATIALTNAAASFVAAPVTLFTRVPASLAYAIVCIVLALSLAAGYVRLRRGGARRTASLRPRDRAPIVPAWLSGLVAVAAVTPLAFIDVAPFAAIIVTAAAVLIAVVGERVSRLPAMLPGGDPVLDAYIDDRLRLLRSVNLLGTATAPAYVFAAITLPAAHTFVALHVAATVVSLAGVLLSVAYMFTVIRRPPDSSAFGGAALAHG